MSVLEGPLVYVDIETNGLSYTTGKIIEVAAIRVEGGIITETLSTLLNPGRPIPPFITGITGITDTDVTSAPEFADIAEQLAQIMDGAVFIAHNVRFDYSFLKNEFRRIGRQFNPKLLCTVKLSRAMYPEQKSHKLQNLIERCNLNVTLRHRAYDDADAMRQFIDHLQRSFPQDLIEKAVAKQIKTPSLPSAISTSLISALPDGPGVYIFEDIQGSPLYIGKSVNIKKRVLSHFASDHTSGSEFKIAQMIANIDCRPTAGELEALLLESQLIKDLQPLYNRRLRRNQKLTLARQTIDKNGYINISIEDTDVIEPDLLGNVLAVYTGRAKAKNLLDEICRNYGLCPKLMGLEKSRAACFAHQLKKCSGACVGAIEPIKYNSLLLDVFDKTRLVEWPYNGPVIVSEVPGAASEYRSLVIDQWCVIADITQPDNCSPSVNFYSRAFDIDAYRILKNYIDAKRTKLHIRPIELTRLHEMTMQPV